MPSGGSRAWPNAESWKSDEIEKVHIAAAACRLSFATAGTALASLTCKCVAMKARTEHACCSHCHHVADLPAARRRDARTLLRQAPFDRNRTLRILLLRQQRAVYPLHRPRPAARTRCRVPVPRACSFSARKGRREADAFRSGSLHTVRRLPCPSRIGLRLLRDRCRVRRSAISFNQ